MRHVTAVALSAGLSALLLLPATPALASPQLSADLRVDANRDGRIDLQGTTDERQENRADVTQGALFLANVDDDQRRCQTDGPDGKPLPDSALVGCWDGADTVVNGPQDAKDLARIRSVPMTSVPDGAVATIKVTGTGATHTHLFLNRGGTWHLVGPGDTLSAAELRTGIEVGIEGTDVVRDAAVWDGRADVTLSVTAGNRTSTDVVSLHEAPLLTHSPVQQAQQLLVSRISSQQAADFDMPSLAPDSARFIAGLRRASSAAGLDQAPLELTGGELFPQDYVEPMYTSFPGPGGVPQTMRVMFGSPQPWRTTARELYERLRGPDVGVVELAPDDHEGGIGDTLSSGGNLETIPPYSYHGHDYPAGRVIMGQDAANGQVPSPALQTFITSQGLQDPLLVDTSWTFVKHVDESIQFLPAETARGWRMAVADPLAGLKVLQDARAAGHGKVDLFSGGKSDNPRLRTISDYLDDPDHVLVDENTRAAQHVAANIALITKETGLRKDEIIHVPALYGSINLSWGKDPDSTYVPPLTAVLPTAVNGVVLTPKSYLAPKQWGPRIHGTDIFAKAVTAAYHSAGMKVTYLDDWAYDVEGGDVHCATNTLRDDLTAWWHQAW
jgi:protein-arginine deiminase